MAEPGAKPESKLRTAVVVYFPMFIAALSLVTAIYNGYLNNRFVTLIQGNVGRVEYMRTCRDIIDAYFQVKLRADLLRTNAGGRADAMNAFDGTHPVFRQSPPRRCRSTSATRAPRPAAPMALTSPAVPPPTTTRS